MALRKSLKFNYFGFLGLLGFLGFQDPWYFLFFLFFLFFLAMPGGGRAGSLNFFEEQAREKQEHKKKIMELAGKQEQIKNDQVQKLLGVSDATAERYLNELEKEGKLKQVGGEQKNTYYSKL